MITLDDMRGASPSRSLFPPTTLKRAVWKLGFVRPTRFVPRRARRT